jgi:hypothetical protein
MMEGLHVRHGRVDGGSMYLLRALQINLDHYMIIRSNSVGRFIAGHWRAYVKTHMSLGGRDA